MTAAALGFDRPTANSLDAVSDRDFALEFLSAAAISAMHLSRLAEEIVIWCSAPYRFIRLSDAFTTGSSIMPQKRNPDAAELVRAKTGRVTGALVALLTVMKGLPLAYAKDMQEDKEPVFDAAEAWALSLAATAGMVRDMVPDVGRMRAFAGSGFATATDLADWLVRVLRLPFRSAHHVTGRLVALAESRGADLADLTLADMQSVEPGITQDVFSVLTVDASVSSRTSYGGTAPANVADQAARWLAALAGGWCWRWRWRWGCWRHAGRRVRPTRPGRRTGSSGHGVIRRSKAAEAWPSDHTVCGLTARCLNPVRSWNVGIVHGRADGIADGERTHQQQYTDIDPRTGAHGTARNHVDLLGRQFVHVAGHRPFRGQRVRHHLFRLSVVLHHGF